MTTKQTIGFGTDATQRQQFGLRHSPARLDREPGADGETRPATFDRELWARLQAMSLDDAGARTPISKRLQAEHRWTASQTDRAIAEYKRFLYLTQRAGFEVTPSRPVDLVWHEHLMHTHHYWGTMCRQVLRSDLHHNPGTGGTVDSDRLSAQYRDTLQAYAEAFGEEPPAEIWPRPAKARRYKRATAATGLAVVAAGSAALLKIWVLMVLAAFAAFVAIVSAVQSAQAGKRQADRGGCGAGCGGGGIGSTGCADSGSGDGGSSGSDGGDGGSSCGGGGCGGGGD